MLAHELDVLDGGAAGREARGGLDEGREHLARNLAELELLVLGEKAVLEDDLGGDVRLATDGHDLGHLILDVVPVPSLDLGEVDHVVNLVRAVGEGVSGLERLYGDGGLPKGEANGGAGVDVGAGEQLGAELGLDRVHRDHLEVIAPGLLAELFHVRTRGIRVQVGVVDEAGKIINRVVLHGSPFVQSDLALILTYT